MKILDLTITHEFQYSLYALGGAFLIRILYGIAHVFYRPALRHASDPKPTGSSWKRAWTAFWDTVGLFHHRSPDAWTGYWLGVVELLIFPLFFKAQAWTLIAGWVAAQITVGWKDWDDSDTKLTKEERKKPYGQRAARRKRRIYEKKLRMRFNLFLFATGCIILMSCWLANRFIEGGPGGAATQKVIVQCTHSGNGLDSLIRGGRCGGCILGTDTLLVRSPHLENTLDTIATRLSSAPPWKPAPEHPHFSLLWIGLIFLLVLLFFMAWKMGRSFRGPALLASSVVLFMTREVKMHVEQEYHVQSEATSAVVDSMTWDMHVRSGPVCVLHPFATGWDTLEASADTVDLRRYTASIRAALHSDSLMEVRIMGSIDERPLGKAGRARFGENTSLAMARAQKAFELLAQGLAPRDRAELRDKTHLLCKGADHHGVGALPDTLALDRNVIIEPIWLSGHATKFRKTPPDPGCHCLDRYMPCILQFVALVTAIGSLVMLIWGKKTPETK